MKFIVRNQFRHPSITCRNELTNIVVENQVIVEIKAIENLQTIHEAQLLNYLKATGYKIGLLINFTHPKAQIKRLIL